MIFSIKEWFDFWKNTSVKDLFEAEKKRADAEREMAQHYAAKYLEAREQVMKLGQEVEVLKRRLENRHLLEPAKDFYADRYNPPSVFTDSKASS